MVLMLLLVTNHMIWYGLQWLVVVVLVCQVVVLVRQVVLVLVDGGQILILLLQMIQ
tara:strand:+ start:43 stop:210 length:168 start_codon:yes stop_codon:yes gene_type:complete